MSVLIKMSHLLVDNNKLIIVLMQYLIKFSFKSSDVSVIPYPYYLQLRPLLGLVSHYYLYRLRTCVQANHGCIVSTAIYYPELSRVL